MRTVKGSVQGHYICQEYKVGPNTLYANEHEELYLEFPKSEKFSAIKRYLKELFKVLFDKSQVRNDDDIFAAVGLDSL